jgi:hypothetical protein
LIILIILEEEYKLWSYQRRLQNINPWNEYQGLFVVSTEDM